MHQLVLTSGSRAEDASYRALADAAQAAAPLADWRVVGGHMVNLHVAAAGLGLPLRATRDADLAVELLPLRAGDLVNRLRDVGYANAQASNRFTRATDTGELAIDVLAPSSGLAHEANLDAGPIVVDGIPGLRIALARPGTAVRMTVTTTTADQVITQVILPDPCSAVALKTLAYAGRFARRDAEDLWRLLEVCYARGIRSTHWPTSPTFQAAADLLRVHFDRPGRGCHDIDTVGEARIRALIRSLIDPAGA